MALQPSKLSDFRIMGPLGSGATARVFDAVHLASGRLVAIKMLAPREDEAVEELRERFAREAIALSQLSSRHTARIVGFGFELGQPFLVLERLQGETIDAHIKREGLVAPKLLGPWIAQLLVGVRDCHAHNVIHRDIKPANIFLQATAGEPVVKLIDFGVAHLSSQHGGASLTSTQHLLGSVGYMAPEQFESGKAVGPLTDLYSVGVVVFRSVTGKLPFSGGSLDRVIQAKLTQDPALVSSIEGAPVFGALDWFVAKAMARVATERFRSAREMLDAWHDIMPLLAAYPSLPERRATTSEPPSPAVEGPPAAPTTKPGIGHEPAAPPVIAQPRILEMESDVGARTRRERDVEAECNDMMRTYRDDPPLSITSESSVAQIVSAAELIEVDIDVAEEQDGEPSDEPESEVFGVYSRTGSQFERGPASVPRTARRGAVAAPRKSDEETTKTYPNLKALVDRELEISRGELRGGTSGEWPRSEGPPTTQHTGPPDAPDEPDDEG